MSETARAGAVVRSRVEWLLPNPANPSPAARHALANLRRGVGKDPGALPQIWQYTHAEGPDGGISDRREAAVHMALTQWALHQQSKSKSMHRADRSFGEALRILASSQDRANPQGTPAYRRMMALANSRSLAAIATHARGLIGQLRAHEIAFDYGRWADDLYWMQVPGHQVDVQRRWGRDFYRLNDRQLDAELDDTAHESATTTDPTQEN